MGKVVAAYFFAHTQILIKLKLLKTSHTLIFLKTFLEDYTSPLKSGRKFLH